MDARPCSISLLALHGALAAIVMATAALMPPARGAMLLLSLDGETADTLATWAVAGDAQLLGPGPLPRSLVVVGDRSALIGPAWRHRSLIVTGAFAGCGGGPVG